eukprot:GEMP01125678.1.p2 GENE.GEMP01125678.1~~GEMP01125678.1.p2  ORF type:complete len:110 (+),score=12.01 GEMP01125678.1:34-363(+)
MGSRTLQRPVVALLGGIPLIIVWALGSLSWFWFHPVMMAISMFPLAGNAILLKKIGGYQNTKYHRYLMMLCTASMCFAWYDAKYGSKLRKKNPLNLFPPRHRKETLSEQ